MISIFQNRLAFALMIVATIILASLFALYALDLGVAPRTYIDIVTTPTFTPGPETPTRILPFFPTLAPLPTNTPIVVPPTPSLVFADNFTTTKHFSLTLSSPNARATISNSIYIIHFDQIDTAFTLLRNFTVPSDNFSIHVDARAANLSRVEYGLLAWHGITSSTGDEHYICFLISPNGSYRIVVQRATILPQSVELVPRTFSRSIRNGLETNTLRVDGHGNRLIFFINDTLISDLSGTQLEGVRNSFTLDGKVGLVATAEFANVDVQFTNFKLFAQ